MIKLKQIRTIKPMNWKSKNPGFTFLTFANNLDIVCFHLPPLQTCLSFIKRSNQASPPHLMNFSTLLARKKFCDFLPWAFVAFAASTLISMFAAMTDLQNEASLMKEQGDTRKKNVLSKSIKTNSNFAINYGKPNQSTNHNQQNIFKDLLEWMKNGVLRPMSLALNKWNWINSASFCIEAISFNRFCWLTLCSIPLFLWPLPANSPDRQWFNSGEM